MQMQMRQFVFGANYSPRMMPTPKSAPAPALNCHGGKTARPQDLRTTGDGEGVWLIETTANSHLTIHNSFIHRWLVIVTDQRRFS